MTGHKHDGALRRREEGRYEKESKRGADLEAENVRLAAENVSLAPEVEHLKKEVKSSNEKAAIHSRYEAKTQSGAEINGISEGTWRLVVRSILTWGQPAYNGWRFKLGSLV